MVRFLRQAFFDWCVFLWVAVQNVKCHKGLKLKAQWCFLQENIWPLNETLNLSKIFSPKKQQKIRGDRRVAGYQYINEIPISFNFHRPGNEKSIPMPIFPLKCDELLPFLSIQFNQFIEHFCVRWVGWQQEKLVCKPTMFVNNVSISCHQGGLVQ